ncbi:MAG TPA: hypothetical protein VF609_02910 [Flavisolibacter sp.]|jgi:hypothetical protein
MKRLYLTFLMIAVLSLLASAQKTVLIREFPMQFLNRDSVIAYYNESYLLIEDSCAAIIRRGFFNDSMGKFTGPFEDRSKRSPRQVVAKGRYNRQGLKEGEFAAWYLSGKLQARGSFKENRYTGIWDFYSPSGKPELTIEVNGADLTILDSWDEDGHRMVKDRKGKHEVAVGPITWSGKIVNGKPHGTWIAALRPFGNRGYIPNTTQQRSLATEIFLDGVFQKGTNATGPYNDSSRIDFLSSISLPLINAETLLLTRRPCNDRYGKKLVYAHHSKGHQQFISELNERLTPLVTLMDTAIFERHIELQMKISEDGRVVSDSVNSADRQVPTLKTALYDLPPFKPATNNGKPVEQGLKIMIGYYQGKYFFNYALAPIEYM